MKMRSCPSSSLSCHHVHVSVWTQSQLSPDIVIIFFFFLFLASAPSSPLENSERIRPSSLLPGRNLRKTNRKKTFKMTESSVESLLLVLVLRKSRTSVLKLNLCLLVSSFKWEGSSSVLESSALVETHLTVTLQVRCTWRHRDRMTPRSTHL